MIHAKVAYATENKQVEIPIIVPKHCTIALAIRRSGILEQFPEINLANIKVGIYGRHFLLDHPLQEGDRVEIYRPLKIDPKQARRIRIKNVLLNDR